MIQVQNVVHMHRQRILGSGIILGAILVLSLIAAGVMQHHTSVQGSGIGLLRTDIALLVAYGIAGTLVWKQRAPAAITAATLGAQIGLIIGAVGIANHLIEAFVPARPFVLIISPVLVTLALFGMAGAAAWERTESLLLAVSSGLCCAIVATLTTLCFAISFNLLFAARVEWQLREAFAVGGMVDQAGFRVRNILEASSEILVRLPLLGLSLALAGAVIQAWMSRESRRVLVLAAGILTPFVFAVGATALWHANAIERAARPPFVLSGVVLTGIAACAAYPVWSSFHRSTRSSRGPGNP
jgi:hypothetical protein